MRRQMCLSLRSRTNIGINVRMYVCIYACVYICMYVPMCAHMKYVRTHARTYIFMYVRMYVCMYIWSMYVRTYERVYKLYVCTYVRTYVYMYIRTHAYNLCHTSTKSLLRLVSALCAYEPLCTADIISAQWDAGQVTMLVIQSSWFDPGSRWADIVFLCMYWYFSETHQVVIITFLKRSK